MIKTYIYTVFTVGIATLFFIGVIPEQVHAYDSGTYKKINSKLSCQCGCGLLVSVCTMDGCMCEGVRKQVGNMLDQGRSEQEITQTMISIYGEQILAAPPKSGFNLSAYILPFVFLVLGGGIVYSIASKWMSGDDESRETDPTHPGNTDPATNSNSLKHRDQIEQELENMDL
ncbi:MAG: cytochrome c-type biogenesis protein CcmH [Candidatus Marinimicrobia bacterium]|nr:cytochrome c-type biogenesis protein CcmH [Candidatus Neomarinimicrobiota bacterium]MCF7828991.1 cytochrome c-type biogenesis protein CcmH [Candidatus Neomarinimicrobiota bacterium]MCF7879951.1 cytochrome c-type biogenesis protein CcmH [Candidatus Neomarinimicrobiota bacterium]